MPDYLQSLALQHSFVSHVTKWFTLLKYGNCDCLHVTYQYLHLLNVFFILLCLPSGSGIPPTQLSKYGNLGHVNVSIVQEPLAFILPKKETSFCLDEREPVPELTAPAPAPEPELPAEESSLEPITPAFPEEGQEQVESGEPLQADVPSEST